MNFNNLSNRTKGIIFIILSAFGFAMMSAFNFNSKTQGKFIW